jgi:hypothetical protein
MEVVDTRHTIIAQRDLALPGQLGELGFTVRAGLERFLVEL